MIYEIINPSDPYTIEGEHQVCCVATCILGEGWYGLRNGDGSEAMPIVAFGVAETWFPKVFGKTFSDLLHATPPEQLAACLDSVLCCSLKERQAYEDALALIEDEGKRQSLRAKWLNERRSSLNNIGRRAYGLAQSLRRT